MPLSKKTSKLFFDKYVNKISVQSVLASEFRSKDIFKVSARIKAIQNTVEKSPEGKVKLRNWHQVHVTIDDVMYMRKLLDILEMSDDFCFRIESDILGIYTNSDVLIGRINQLGQVHEISKPANAKVRDFLLSRPNAIIAKSYTHKYRVTINPLRENSEKFHTWAEKIPSIKLLKRTYHSEGYFYAANEKALGMARLFLSGKIRRVDEMFLESEI